LLLPSSSALRLYISVFFSFPVHSCDDPKGWADKYDECKLLTEQALDLRPPFSVMPNWRAVLAANDVVEVKLPKVEVNNDGNDKNDKNSNSSSSKASSSRTSSLELWYTAQVVRMEADKGLVHVRALVGGTNTRNYTVDVDADNLCKIGTHQDEASARKAVRELPPDKGDSAGVAAAATSPAPPNTEAATGSSSSS